MHSSLVRLQNSFGFFTSVAFTLAGIIALTSLLHPQSPSAKLHMSNVSVVKGRPHYYSTRKEEYAHIKFDLSADLTSLFSWNTKQVFIYIVAVFPSHHGPNFPPSEAVIWDAIVPSSLAPWHENTYIHPGTTKSPKQSRDRRLRTHDPQLDEFKAYPKGKSEGVLKLDNQRPKYQVTTPTGKLAGLENCTLYLRYNVQPWVGMLQWDANGAKGGWLTPFWRGIKGGRSQVFELPAVKGSQGTKTKEDLATEAGAEARKGKPS
ncbi:signal peptidase subunit-domain-containing protein [Elsinoe ampelina]|uniref:Signal peptidase subunit 3 n=1 Tax=Elsinoe ampelina TaxID=302913 RepID=A0A6A6G473_9PEZI|nr:signal peptidase subunit-domain-containing protein [Elsinoe ampelina]